MFLGVFLWLIVKLCPISFDFKRINSIFNVIYTKQVFGEAPWGIAFFNMINIKRLLFFLAITFSLGLTQCTSPMVERIVPVEKSVEDYIAGAGLDYQQQGSGYYISTIQAGNGTPISVNNVVEARVTVYDLEDQKIDDAVQRFRVGQQAILPLVLDEALSTLSEGAEVRILLPSELAWKSFPFRQLPSNSSLRVDVTVTKVFSEADWKAQDLENARLVFEQVKGNLQEVNLSSRYFYASESTISQPTTTGRLKCGLEAVNLDKEQVSLKSDTTLYYDSAIENNLFEGLNDAFLSLAPNAKGYLVFPSELAYDAGVTVVPSFLREECAENGIIAPLFADLKPFGSIIVRVDEFTPNVTNPQTP